MPFAVVLDACVLVPLGLCDSLLRLAETGLYRPLWSDEILEEVRRTLANKLGLGDDRARRRVDAMRRAFPDALVENHESLIAAMTNDPKDRHVLAAAVRADAALLVTANVKDFPPASVDPYDIDVVHPDDFLLDQLELDHSGVLTCLREQRAAYRDPAMDVHQFYEMLSGTVPLFARAARSIEQQRHSADVEELGRREP
ncbi:PIN domain-containing protein [Isoptericola sp. AK164]|uniref:PIN domain-containing protein n=1 Tax=Isoptericola sp. AK164 TaxID=3024246 RepID=UPI0024185FB2|nr:PIN domain-containing protein [Isoptericola sp. AK164]